jgi:CRP-like cAMP-binding protein
MESDFLSPADRAVLLAAGTVRRFDAGEVLCREGDAAHHVMLIEDGRVKVVSVGRGGQSALLAIRGPGDLVGEFGVLAGRPRSADVVALERVRVRVVPASRFTSFLKERPEAANALLRTILARLREADRRRLEFAVHDVPTRVALLLLELAGSSPDDPGAGAGAAPRPIAIALSQREIADATGASREAVVKALRRMRSQGLVSTSRRAITILRLDRLVLMSETDSGSGYLDADRPGGTP